jgi:hypothetical protein
MEDRVRNLLGRRTPMLTVATAAYNLGLNEDELRDLIRHGCLNAARVPSLDGLLDVISALSRCSDSSISDRAGEAQDVGAQDGIPAQAEMEATTTDLHMQGGEAYDVALHSRVAEGIFERSDAD